MVTLNKMDGHSCVGCLNVILFCVVYWRGNDNILSRAVVISRSSQRFPPLTLPLSSKMDRSSSERATRCHPMSPVYWSTGGNFLAAPDNKHITIMNIRGKSDH